MKTKTRTFIAICALGIIGLTNINAISDDKREEVVNNKGEMLDIESTMTDEALMYSARTYAALDFDNEATSILTTGNFSEQNILSDEVAVYSAQAYASLDFENEITEYVTDQILPQENALAKEVIYSAKTFAALDFENEINNR